MMLPCCVADQWRSGLQGTGAMHALAKVAAHKLSNPTPSMSQGGPDNGADGGSGSQAASPEAEEEVEESHSDQQDEDMEAPGPSRESTLGAQFAQKLHQEP